MKVFLQDGDALSLIGHADVPENESPWLDVLFQAEGHKIEARFRISAVPAGMLEGSAPERCLVMIRGHRPEILPGWKAV